MTTTSRIASKPSTCEMNFSVQKLTKEVDSLRIEPAWKMIAHRIAPKHEAPVEEDGGE